MSLDLWVDFFDDLQNVRGRSQNTVMAYRRDLELYAEYSKKSKTVSGFYEFLRQRHLSTRSQARVISSVRTYLRFCESRGRECPELRELRPPKVKTQLPKVLSLEQFQGLMEAAKVENVYRAARNQMTLLMLFGLGCRVSELIQLNLIDYHEADAWLRIVGKGNKERVVPLTEKLNHELKDYLIHVRSHLNPGTEKSILINDRGKRPSRVDIWRWLSAWSKKAGFEEVVHPHQFRHGCATALLESGADLRSIQMLLGHSSIQTTQVYTNVTVKTMQETVDQLHPLATKKN